MRRRVLYDGTSRGAAAAVSLLGDEFDVGELDRGGRLPDVDPAVLLVDERSHPPRAAHVRIVALVEQGARGPWPDHWYALLPVGVVRPVLVRTLDNAFADLARTAEVERLDRELSELNTIGIRLTAERDPDVLLELILQKAREITHSDAGSLYLVEEAEDGARRLRFALAQNDSVAIPFQATTLPLTNESVAGHTALTGEVVNLADAYVPAPGAPFHINRSFDEQVGYRTKSMLVVPMRTPKGETIGALQLINYKPEFSDRLASPAAVERLVQPYSSRYERLAGSLASQAAVALDNSRLYESIRRLFEGFVKASVTAIESRDPTTSGHSFRVAELTVGLAEVVDRCVAEPYRRLRFTADEMMELRYAALLHDFGKVGVREQVLVKAKKLYPAELDRIRQRVELIKRSLELRITRQKLDHVLDRGLDGYAERSRSLDKELEAALAELDESLARVVAANEPAVLAEDVAAAIERLALRAFEDHRGERQAVVTPEEAQVLAIARGSLTRDEFLQIQSHVVHTFQFLAQIPWTREFRRIPEIARSHHEKLDGSGYPYGWTAEAIPVQSKMMTIADIYDALTAWDRPYKRAVPAETALDILDADRRAGRLDGDLLDLFIAAKVYERTRPR